MSKKKAERKSIERALAKEGSIVRPVYGDSMMPLLDQKTDFVKLVPVKKKEINTFDLPLYRRRDGKLVLHRIIAKKGRRFITRGDNRMTLETVKPGQIIALATGYFRDGVYHDFSDPDLASYLSTIRSGRRVPLPEWAAFITLVRQALGGKTGQMLPEGAKPERMLGFAESHAVSALLYHAIDPTTLPDAVRIRWKQDADAALHRAAIYQLAWGEIRAAFNKAGVRYMELKGMTIAALYPARGTREFHDYDLLCDVRESAKIREILEGLRFTYKGFSGVHDVYQRDGVSIEIHRFLFELGRNAFATYFAGALDRAIPSSEGTGERRMKPAEKYVYLIAHLYRHIQIRGGGIRPYADLYLVKKTLTQSEHAEAVELAKQLDLFRFFNYTEKICQELFAFDTIRISYEDCARMVLGGLYGTIEDKVSRALETQSRGAYLRSRLFPSFGRMRESYPVLGRAPFLLPVFWVYRILRLPFHADMRRRAKLERQALRKK